jgi:hypothetical protein
VFADADEARATPASSMVASRRSCRSEKQATQQQPPSGSATSSGLPVASIRDSAERAGKSLSKANEPEYCRLRAPVARALPGQR